MAINFGDILGGLGAAYGGTAQQYAQGIQQREQGLTEQKRAELEARQRAMYQDGYQAFMMLGDPDKDGDENLDGIISLANDRLEMLSTFQDADPSDTMEVLNLASAAKAGDSSALPRLTQILYGAANTAVSMGIVPQQAAPEIIKGGDLYRGQVVTRDLAGNVTMTAPEGMDATTYIDPDEQIDARTYIRGGVSKINDNLAEIAGAYSKVISLEPAMRAGDRGAINAAIMNVARLISPGVVTDQDARALSGTDTNIGAIYGFLQGRGFDTDQFLKIYDPTNPEVFSVDNLMTMAKNITSSSVPTYQNQLADFRTMSDTYQLSKQFTDSFFNKGELYGQIDDIMASLSGIASPQGSGPQTINVNTEEEANAAMDTLPVGSTIRVLNGNTYVVEEK
jgi:hypothetical protein